LQGRYGVLGHGDEVDRPTPEKLECEGMGNVAGVSVGDGFTVALANDGRLWSWGRGQFGCLGHGKAKKAKKGEGKNDGASKTSAKHDEKPKPKAAQSHSQSNSQSKVTVVTSKKGAKNGGGKGKGKVAHQHHVREHKDQWAPKCLSMNKHQGKLENIAAGCFHAMCTQRAGELQEYIELIGLRTEGCTLSAVKHQQNLAMDIRTMVYVAEELAAKVKAEAAAAEAAKVEAEAAAEVEAAAAEEAEAASAGGVPPHLLRGLA
jgi:hypothetical protein